MRSLLCLLAPLLMVLFPHFARAQEKANPANLEACKDQLELYCDKELKTPGDKMKCLFKHHDVVSVSCKQELQRIFKASRQTAMAAGGDFGLLGGLAGMGGSIFSFSYDGKYVPAVGESTPSVNENNLSLSAPIHRTDKGGFSASFSAGNLKLSQDVKLDSGKVVPSELSKAEFGLSYSGRLEDQKSFGVRAYLGYSGDKLDSKTESFGLIANYSYPGADESRWVWLVMLSNNSPLGAFFPLPGFIYIYRTPTMTGIFGFPIFSIQWTPQAPWSYSLSAFGPVVKAEAAYGLVDEGQYFLGAAMRQQRYMLSDRTQERERLTAAESVIEAGYRGFLFDLIFTEFSVGHSFSRTMYMGEGLFERTGGKASFEPGSYLKWTARFAF